MVNRDNSPAGILPQPAFDQAVSTWVELISKSDERALQAVFRTDKQLVTGVGFSIEAHRAAGIHDWRGAHQGPLYHSGAGAGRAAAVSAGPVCRGCAGCPRVVVLRARAPLPG
ncbi:MAG: hypothetical protein WKG07_21035 [Hymenobacter sp.]